MRTSEAFKETRLSHEKILMMTHVPKATKIKRNEKREIDRSREEASTKQQKRGREKSSDRYVCENGVVITTNAI